MPMPSLKEFLKYTLRKNYPGVVPADDILLSCQICFFNLCRRGYSFQPYLDSLPRGPQNDEETIDRYCDWRGIA